MILFLFIAQVAHKHICEEYQDRKLDLSNLSCCYLETSSLQEFVHAAGNRLILIGSNICGWNQEQFGSNHYKDEGNGSLLYAQACTLLIQGSDKTQ